MGSLLTLGIGKMEVDWGKNRVFNNHSKLFLPGDKKKIPYYRFDLDSEESVSELKDGYARPLSSVKKRLDLLGYSMRGVEEKYNLFLDELEVYLIDIKIPFHQIRDVIYNMDIQKVNTIQWEEENYENGYDLGEYTRYCLMKESKIKKWLN